MRLGIWFSKGAGGKSLLTTGEVEGLCRMGLCMKRKEEISICLIYGISNRLEDGVCFRSNFCYQLDLFDLLYFSSPHHHIRVCWMLMVFSLILDECCRDSCNLHTLNHVVLSCRFTSKQQIPSMRGGREDGSSLLSGTFSPLDCCVSSATYGHHLRPHNGRHFGSAISSIVL